MRLTQEQILKLLKAPKNRDAIELAATDEQWLRMHCEPIQQKQNLPNQAYRDFTIWAKSLITAEKYPRFQQLCQTPFETVTVTKDIFDQLGKFLDAQDQFIKCDFVSADISADFHDYLERIKDADFWRSKAMDALRVGINSIIVCDLPDSQLTTNPEPYYYFLDICNVIDIDINDKEGSVEYLIFKADSHTIIAIDDEFYRIYKAADKDNQVINVPYIGSGNSLAPCDNLIGSNFIFVSEVPHSFYNASGKLVSGLGYCPAIDFYGRVISKTNRICKRGPVTDVITKLNFLLFFGTLAKYYSMYGPFPIICMYKVKEKYQDQKSAETTDNNAFITGQFSAYDIVSVDVVNPKTQKKNLIGGGETVSVAAPQQQGDFDHMEYGPVKVIEMSVDNLEWVRKMVEYLSDEIVEICTGQDSDLINAAAKNQDQIAASFERKQSILVGIKNQFDRARKFCLQTTAILRYSRKYYVSTTVDHGTDYFLKDATTLTDEYSAAVKAGMPLGYVYSLKKNVIATKYKNNPDELSRQNILLDLEPYIDLSISDMKTNGLDVSDWTNYIVKLNFNDFIRRFEMENTNVVAFGALINYDKKISLIKTKLQTYGAAIRQPKADLGTN